MFTFYYQFHDRDKNVERNETMLLQDVAKHFFVPFVIVGFVDIDFYVIWGFLYWVIKIEIGIESFGRMEIF